MSTAETADSTETFSWDVSVLLGGCHLAMPAELGILEQWRALPADRTEQRRRETA